MLLIHKLTFITHAPIKLNYLKNYPCLEPKQGGSLSIRRSCKRIKKMKKYFALIIATTLSLSSQAREVDSLLARTTASTFLSSKGMKSVVNDITPKNFSGNLYLYAGEKGYVLLPADDAVRQVLAYSTESSFPADDIPPHVQALLQAYSDVVEYARQNDLPQHPSWKTNPTGTDPSPKDGGVAPVVTARWGQGYPYNTLCPLDCNWIDTCLQCVTGCVATAMAQIMHYWQWPVRGWGHDGCWFYNQDGWHTLDSAGVWATWMIRALTSPYTGPLGIDNVSSYQPINVYPNPTHGKVTITSPEALAETAWLTDLTGRREQVRLVPQGHSSNNTLTQSSNQIYSLDLSATQTFKQSSNQAILLTLTTASGKTHTVRLLKLPDISRQ